MADRLNIATGGAFQQFVTNSDPALNIRNRILAAIDTRLRGITIAQGYNTDVGAHVTTWKANPFEVDNLPVVEYRDVQEELADFSIGEELHRMTVDIIVAALDVATVRSAFSDIEIAIGTDTKWGGLADQTVLITNTITTEHREKYFSMGTFTIRIDYVTLNFNPYSNEL